MDGYGVINLLKGEKPGPAALTPPQKPKIAPDELPLLTRLNDEFARLSAAVQPSVVSVTTKTVRPGAMSWHPFYGLVGQREQIVPSLGSGSHHQQGGACGDELPCHRGAAGGHPDHDE